MADPAVVNLIRRYSQKYGVDPRAALAVAQGEGGLRYGAVGDQGTSYGPFQLHRGGALPRGRDATWANSPAGIEYALRSMAGAGARGRTGRAAVEAIVRRFERPANPDKSISLALSRYGGGSELAEAPAPVMEAGGTAAAAVAPAPRTGRGRDFALDLISSLRSGGDVQGLVSRFKATQALPETQARMTGGTTQGPSPSPAGNAVTSKAVRVAAEQIGKPYVWGGEEPSEGGFDCSGLIDYAYRRAGVDLPGRLTTQTALGMGRSVKGTALMPGDMVITNGGKHMVLYAGGGRVIAAPHRGAVVRYQPLSDFEGSIVDVRRVG